METEGGELKDALMLSREIGCTRNSVSTWARRLEIEGTVIGRTHYYSPAEAESIRVHLIPNLERRISKKHRGPGRRPRGDELYEEASKVIYAEMLKGRMMTDSDFKGLAEIKRAHGLVDYMTTRYDIYEETVPGKQATSWTGIQYGAACAYRLRKDIENGNCNQEIGDGPGDAGEHTEVRTAEEGRRDEPPGARQDNGHDICRPILQDAGA